MLVQASFDNRMMSETLFALPPGFDVSEDNSWKKAIVFSCELK